jgi:hypothetical protein
MRAHGHEPNVPSSLNVAMAHVEAGNLARGWSLLQPMLQQKRQQEQQQQQQAGAQGGAEASPSSSST